MPSLTLGDGTVMETEGWVDLVLVSMPNQQDRAVNTRANFLIVRKLPEQVVIGHQYFLESKALSGRQAEISYSKKSLMLGHHLIPWRYELPATRGRKRNYVACATQCVGSPRTIQRVCCVYQDATVSPSQWGVFYHTSRM